MRIIDKYITKKFLVSFSYCLTLFILLYIIIDLFGQLDEILKHNVSLLILQEYYLSMIPFIIMHTAPISALISTIYVLSTMNKYDELTAMRASGINIFRVLLPFITLGLAISVGIFAISEKVLPANMKNALYIKENYLEKGEQDKTKDTIDNIALYGKNDRLIFIKSYDKHSNIAEGITIIEQDNLGNVLQKINAKEGKWTGANWLFSDILIYQLDSKGMIEGHPSFYREAPFDMESPRELISKGTHYEFMSFKDLSNYIQNFSNTSPDIINRIQVDLHNKISFPFTSLVVILIGAGLAIKIRQRRKGSAIMGIGITIVIGFMYYTFIAISVALGKSELLSPILSAHLPNIVFGLVGLMLIRN